MGELGRGPARRRTLASVRFQETGQRPTDAAQAIVDFLREGAGRVVDTAKTPDDTRVIAIVGYLVDRPVAEGSER
jgi:hypothetical protein